MVDSENAITVKILNTIIGAAPSPLLPNKSLLIGTPNTDNPIPHGKAIIMENLSAISILFFTTDLSPATYERTSEGTIAVDNADAMAIGIVVRVL